MDVGSKLSEALVRYLDVTSNQMKLTAANLANQNTAGYTRQVVSFTATDSVSLNGFANGNESVEAKAVSQRDRVLEQRLQQATQSSSASSSRLTALQDVQQMFGLSSTTTNASSTVLGSAVDGFFASLTSLSANPSDPATRQAVLTAATTLASAFNSAASGLQAESVGLSSQIGTAASQINGLTATIAELNGQITALSPDADAGALEDSRQQAIKQLSGLLGVNQIATENNGLTLTTSSGAVLVSGSQAISVATTSIGGVTQLVAGSPPETQTNVTGGVIGGLSAARDEDIPGMLAALDQLASAIGTAVNAQNADGVTGSGAAGSAIFSLPSSVAGSAAEISVLTSATVATAGAGEGPDGTANAVALAKLGAATTVAGQSASDFFATFIGALGQTVSSATTDQSAQSGALTQAQTQRDAFSGVSLDEEASSLTQYQRSYEAAAKVFDIVNQLFASVLNLGQESTVS